MTDNGGREATFAFGVLVRRPFTVTVPLILLSLVLAAQGIFWGHDTLHGVLALLVGGVAAGFGMRALFVAYVHWLRGQEQRLVAQTVAGAVGIVGVWVAAGLLERSSDWNARFLTAVAVGLVVVAFIPIAHLVQFDSVDAAPEADLSTLPAVPSGLSRLRQEVVAWVLNLVTIALPVVVGVLLVGGSVLVGLVLTVFWFVTTAIGRIIDRRWFSYVLGGAVGLGLGALVMLVFVPSVQVAVLLGLLATLLGMMAVVARWLRLRVGIESGTLPDWAGNTKVLLAIAIPATVLIVVSFGLLAWQFGEASLLQIAGVTAVLVALGAAFVARGEGYAVLVVVGLVAVWVVADRDAGPADSLRLVTDVETSWAEPADTIRMVALGDSYSSGEGAAHFLPGTNVEGGNNCRRADTAYGPRVADRFGWELAFFACQGGLAEQIAADVAVDVGAPPPTRLPEGAYQVDRVPADIAAGVDVVTMSIGGNDALFSTIGRACAVPGSCNDIREVFDSNLRFVTRRVASALTAIGERFTSARIVLVPYPKMLGAEHCADVPLDGEEFAYLNDFLDELNRAVANAVPSANAALSGAGVDSRAVFFQAGTRAYAGHELCPAGSEPAAMNVLTLSPTDGDSLSDRVSPGAWIHQSFHPTERGHELMACQLERFLIEQFTDELGLVGRTWADGCDELMTEASAVTAPPPATDGTIDAAADGADPDEPQTVVCDERTTCRALADRFVALTLSDVVRTALPAALLLLASGAALMVLVLLRPLRSGSALFDSSA